MCAKVSKEKRLCLEEATIEAMHRAIQAGEVTVLEIVQRYIARSDRMTLACIRRVRTH